MENHAHWGAVCKIAPIPGQMLDICLENVANHTNLCNKEDSIKLFLKIVKTYFFIIQVPNQPSTSEPPGQIQADPNEIFPFQIGLSVNKSSSSSVSPVLSIIQVPNQPTTSEPPGQIQADSNEIFPFQIGLSVIKSSSSSVSPVLFLHNTSTKPTNH